jgi:hypothetical protein
METPFDFGVFICYNIDMKHIYKFKQLGIAPITIILIILFLVAIGGAGYYLINQESQIVEDVENKQEIVQEEESFEATLKISSDKEFFSFSSFLIKKAGVEAFFPNFVIETAGVEESFYDFSLNCRDNVTQKDINIDLLLDNDYDNHDNYCIKPMQKVAKFNQQYAMSSSILGVNFSGACYFEICLDGICKKTNNVTIETGNELEIVGGYINFVDKIYIDNCGGEYKINDDTKFFSGYDYDKEVSMDEFSMGEDYAGPYLSSLVVLVNEDGVRSMNWSPQ